MELEQRVKALEYEIKILKNEIQRTLLDIQEQVLVHYYPSLRTEEAKPSEGTAKVMEELRARQAAQSPAAALAAAQAAPAAPIIKKVSLDEIRTAQTELEAEAPSTAPAATNLTLEALVKQAGGLEALVKQAGSLEAALRMLGGTGG